MESTNSVASADSGVYLKFLICRVSLLQYSTLKQREAISRLLSQSQSLHAPSGRGRSNSRGSMASGSMHGKIVYRSISLHPHHDKLCSCTP